MRCRVCFVWDQLVRILIMTDLVIVVGGSMLWRSCFVSNVCTVVGVCKFY